MHICFLALPTEMFGICGTLHTLGKCKITVEKRKRNICSRLVIVDQGGQKSCNGKSSTLIIKELNFNVEQAMVEQH